MKVHLHFTFGPVQSFVAQARRTRDLYAGSLLLSKLALTAMRAARDAGGKVILPDFDFLEKLATDPDLKHAIAPNRFIAEFSNEAEAAEAGRQAGKALQEQWGENIAENIWTHFLNSVAVHGSGTRAIWERQIHAFWEIAWAVGDEKETDLLDRRKNWRTPRSTPEGGDHCTLMGQWQELSGFIRSHHRKQQDDFWTAVRRQLGNKQLDLEEDERFCAIAFIKRFYRLVSNEVVKLEMQYWPSTVSIAAVPWQRKIRDEAKPEVLVKAKAYAELVGNEPGARVSSARRLAGLKGFSAAAGEFSQLSGNFLNHTALQNQRGTPLNEDDNGRRELLRDELRNLEKTTYDHAGNFYALLLMDGDRLGALIREHTAKVVTPCLTEFSSNAPQLIENEKHSGICVYAGGDDLLAMLPLDSALEAVTAVRELYVTSFAGAERKIAARISAGLVFAHYRCAFSRVLDHAHHLLDDVAKDGADRDALAIGVLKPGGVACQWVAKFGDFLRNGAHCFTALVKGYERGERGERDGLSSSFLYNLCQRFSALFGPSGAEPFDSETLRQLFVAEYLHGRIDKDLNKARHQREEAGKLMRQLIAVCRQPDPRRPDRQRFDLDGARLVKFLALDGKEGAE